MTPLERIIERISRNGDINDPEVARPLLTLEEFYDGNDEQAIIGCNLTEPPSAAEFYEFWKRIRSRPDVADVLVQITMWEGEEAGWPFSDAVWVITSVPPEEVAAWFDPSIRPDECNSGWPDHYRLERCPVPKGMSPIVCWWD